MLTDGEITDMAKTKRAIIAASRLPLSIIIVGVGGANFDAMNELDSDEQKLELSYGIIQYTDIIILSLKSFYHKRLQIGREVAQRDIVQFVPFREFAHVSKIIMYYSVMSCIITIIVTPFVPVQMCNVISLFVC